MIARALPAFLFSGFLSLAPAHAALTQAELDAVGLEPAAGATVPREIEFHEADGRSTTLGAILGQRPALLILADYHCREICGPIVAVAGEAFMSTGLRPGVDADLIVVGMNPTAGPADAAAMGGARLDDAPDVARTAHLLTGSAAAVAALEGAIGYHAVHDDAARRYAHPTDVLVLTPGGTVSEVLPGLALDPSKLRSALVAAGRGGIGELARRIHLLCYGLDPASGEADGAAQAMLVGGTLATLAGLGWFVWRLRHAASRSHGHAA